MNSLSPKHFPDLDFEVLGSNPTKRIVQSGSFLRLPEILKSLRPKTILLVLGQKSFKASSHYPLLEKMLSGYKVIFSSSIPPNPTIQFLTDEMNRLRLFSIDLVLAIGGGSVLDSAKIFAAAINEDPQIFKDAVESNYRFTKNPIPLIAIPTTSGSGSEVTPTASIETSDKRKISLDHDHFYPFLALVDPELTYSMTSYVTASTGFDALSQAIESFWSTRATDETRMHSLKSLEFLLQSFERILQNPKDKEARNLMAAGSSEAGVAIAQTKTTAVHSVSYPITAHFLVAHGHACALTLSSFVRFNAPVLKEIGKPLLNRFGVSDYDVMAEKINELMVLGNLERSFEGLGIRKEGLNLIVQDGFRPDRVKNNPRPLTSDELLKMLEQLYRV